MGFPIELKAQLPSIFLVLEVACLIAYIITDDIGFFLGVFIFMVAVLVGDRMVK